MGERGEPQSVEIGSRLTPSQVESEEERGRKNERNKETDIRHYFQRARSLTCKKKGQGRMKETKKQIFEIISKELDL